MRGEGSTVEENNKVTEKNVTITHVNGGWLWVTLCSLIVLFAGEPDLLDALITYLLKCGG